MLDPHIRENPFKNYKESLHHKNNEHIIEDSPDEFQKPDLDHYQKVDHRSKPI